MLNYPLLGFCLSKYETDFSIINYDPFNKRFKHKI